MLRYDLPRHMRLVHKWSDGCARYVKAQFGLRKEYTSVKQRASDSRKDYHKTKACPVDGCKAVTKVMSRHLKKSHGMSPNNPEYKVLLKRAVTIDHPKSKQTSEKTVTKKQSLLPLLLQNDDLSSGSDDSNFLEDIGDHSSGSDEDDGSSESSYSSNVSEEGVSTSSDVQSNKAIAKDLLDAFYQFLTSADSGNKDERSAKQCQSRIKKILHVVDQDMDIQSLVDRHLLRDIFLRRHCAREKYEPKTVQTYLKTLEHFYDFVISEGISAYDMTKVASLKSKVKVWKKSYVTQVKIASMAKMERERRTKIKPEHIVKFEQSSIVRDVIKMLGRLGEGRKCEVTQSRFTCVRDFLMTQILINNGHRAGVLANMMIAEYSNVEARDGKYAITVFKHKEARAGPMRVTLSSKLFEWLTIFVEKFRASVTSDVSSNAAVFVTWTGEKFANSGGVTNACSALWTKAGMKGRVGGNKFRKAAVSATRESCKADEQIHKDLANLMGHKKSTADRYYYLEEKIESADRAAEALPLIMRRCAPEESLVNREERMETHSVPEGIEKKRRTFSFDEVEEIRNTFDCEIKEGAPITMEQIRTKIKTSQELIAKNPRRIYDKVKKLQKEQKEQKERCTLQLPREEESLNERIARYQESISSADKSKHENDYDFVCQSSRSSKDLFTKNDVAMLQRGFAAILSKKSVTDKEINLAVATNAAAKSIASKFRLETIKNRLKYEIRKARSERKLL